MTGEELDQAKRIMEHLPKSLGMRRTRRYKAGKGRLIDLRRTLRESMRQRGEIFKLPTRSPKQKPRPIVLICDISGSMERYTRVLLHFMHTLASSMYQVESFVFSTDLTRITRQIRQKSVDEALHDVGYTVKQWGAERKQANRCIPSTIIGQGVFWDVAQSSWSSQMVGIEAIFPCFKPK